MSRSRETDLPDAGARLRVETDTAATLFVEAGAGTGKTRALVRRLGRLLLVDGVEMGAIAAITFTEKAAAELRDRLRTHLVAARTDGELSGGAPGSTASPAAVARADAALAALDTAALGTLHSFALRLLAENPLEAGTPPRIVTQQDTAADAADAWLADECHSALFGPDRDEVVREAVDELLAGGASPATLGEIALALHADWDRLDPALESTPPQRPGPLDLTEIESAVTQILAWIEVCTNAEDKLVLQLRIISEWAEELRAAAEEDPTRALELLGSPKGPGGGGAKANWPGGAAMVTEIKNEIKALQALCGRVRDAYWGRRLDVVLAVLAPVVLRHAEQRRRRGTLQFHDQLVRARELLTDPAVRERVRARYPRVLIDEFQDTDPLQLDLARLLACAPDGTAGVPDGLVPPEPGRLFTVGDPKQSIYRFRRADISTYLRAQSSPGVELQRLTTNFRCTRAVIEWVNRVFGEVLVAETATQPEYVPLDAAPWRPPHDPRFGPAPFVFRTGELPPAHVGRPETDAQELGLAEASDIARIIRTALEEGWTHETEDGPRLLALSDIAILLPTRTALRDIEDCLDAAGIDYRAEASSIVYGTPEIRDLLLAVRAVATTADSAAVVGALRSPLYACSDEDLLRWRATGGSWAPGAPAPADLTESPVAEGLGHLAELSRSTRRPGELLERLVTERMVFESVAESPRRRDLWRRIRFVIEHAWQWEDSADDPGRADLRDYADHALALTAEDARVPEAVIPETDVDAVRITTMHASKGLEYPMVIVAGMSRKIVSRSRHLYWSADGRPLLSLTEAQRTAGVADAKALEQRHERAEKIRLMYVAATRAASRLAVSGYGYKLTRPKKGEDPALATGLMGHLFGWVIAEPDAPPLAPFPLVRPRRDVSTPAPLDAAEWERESAEVAARSAERAGWSATRIVHPAEEPAADPEAPGGDPTEHLAEDVPLPERLVAALRSRFAVAPVADSELPRPPRRQPVASGTGVGTAVHHLAELTDLAALPVDESGWSEWGRWARAQLLALGVGDLEGEAAIAEMVSVARTALDSEPVRRASALEHHRELPLAGLLSADPGGSGVPAGATRSGEGPAGDGAVVGGGAVNAAAADGALVDGVAVDAAAVDEAAVDGVAVDGVADLVVREADGSWTIVDYKTDVGVTAETADAYLLQLCAYAELLGRVTGRRVGRLELVFCRGDAATVLTRTL